MEFYEECAKKVAELIHDYHTKTKDVADAVQKIATDTMYTDVGKKTLTDKLQTELADTTKAVDDDVKSVVKDFCERYQIDHVDQSVDQLCISNALKIIEISGFSLTPELLRTALEPLKKSYKSLKMIASLLHAKNDGAVDVKVTYKYEVIDVMNEYLGMTNSLYDYEKVFDEVKSVLDVPELFHTGIHGIPGPSGRVVNRLITDDTYAVLALADNMMKVGKMYEIVRMEYPETFE